MRWYSTHRRTHLYRSHYTGFSGFCWAKARLTGCVAFSSCPRYICRLGRRRRPRPRRAARCPKGCAIGRRRKWRGGRWGRKETGTVHPGGGPGSVKMTGNSPGLPESLLLLLLLLHARSSLPRTEQRGRWCRTSL